MWRGISLANKCLLLFGAAVALIIVAALSVPWLRMNSLVDEGEFETSRQLVIEWLARADQPRTGPGGKEALATGSVAVLSVEEARRKAPEDWFLAASLEWFQSSPKHNERNDVEWETTSRRYHYARAERDPDGAVSTLVVLDRTSGAAARQIVVNTAYMLSAGLIAGGVAVLVFYLITTKIILGPVRALKDTAELIREGNASIRSEIATGDEFEELSETFNQMVERLATTQDQLRAINKSLDLKLNELAERNVSLFEAAKLKGEFLANVSHELRTPLNSIIGFTELLIEISEREAAAGDDSTRLAKRRRYLDNIINSGRNLLEMINSLLDMAKIEAGKMELRIEPLRVADLCEGLLALMKPQADRAGVELVSEIQPDLPVIETDPKKFQQVIFNLLSNALKFTGPPASGGGSGSGPGAGGAPGADGLNGVDHARSDAARSPRLPRVVLRAERLIGRGDKGISAEERIRVSVLDTGPGIAPEDQRVIFEKFRQLESGHTRRHAGTGLGLAISKELTSMLQGEIQLESEVGRGSMFSVILPLRIDPARAAEMRLEMGFRGSLAAQKGST